MKEFRITSISEQAADFLREQILRGRWSGEMPGRHELAVELGINHKTVEAALRQLEEQGFLAKRGSGRRRSINPLNGNMKPPSLRIAIMTGMSGDRTQDFMVETKHRLIEEGHSAFYTEPSLNDLGMDMRRIARLVRRTEVDAWVVVAGSGMVLEWFSERESPVFALFGRRQHLRIAGSGPDKSPAYAEAVRALLALGHRRIVLLTHASRRQPSPGASECAFLAELAAAGIPVGDYHLPNWAESPEGFQQRLELLFHVTPPTALILDSAPLFAAAQHFLHRCMLRVPDDVSLVCTDEPEDLVWQRPCVSHIRWDSRPVVRRVVNWAANVSRGKVDIRQTLAPAQFITGGTIGPVKENSPG